MQRYTIIDNNVNVIKISKLVTIFYKSFNLIQKRKKIIGLDTLLRFVLYCISDVQAKIHILAYSLHTFIETYSRTAELPVSPRLRRFEL